MECQVCGYEMTAFDEECPKCLRLRLEQRTGQHAQNFSRHDYDVEPSARDYPNLPWLIVVAICMPPVGLAIGAYMLTQDSRIKHAAGKAIILWTLLFPVLLSAVAFVLFLLIVAGRVR
jgi:hypothetical protein